MCHVIHQLKWSREASNKQTNKQTEPQLKFLKQLDLKNSFHSLSTLFYRNTTLPPSASYSHRTFLRESVMVFFCFNQIASDCPLGVTACMESRPFRTLFYVRGSPPFPVMKLPALMAVKKKNIYSGLSMETMTTKEWVSNSFKKNSHFKQIKPLQFYWHIIDWRCLKPEQLHDSWSQLLMLYDVCGRV